jgi:hypothetical protein
MKNRLLKTMKKVRREKRNRDGSVKRPFLLEEKNVKKN